MFGDMIKTYNGYTCGIPNYFVFEKKAHSICFDGKPSV